MNTGNAKKEVDFLMVNLNVSINVTAKNLKKALSMIKKTIGRKKVRRALLSKRNLEKRADSSSIYIKKGILSYQWNTHEKKR